MWCCGAYTTGMVPSAAIPLRQALRVSCGAHRHRCHFALGDPPTLAISRGGGWLSLAQLHLSQIIGVYTDGVPAEVRAMAERWNSQLLLRGPRGGKSRWPRAAAATAAGAPWRRKPVKVSSDSDGGILLRLYEKGDCSRRMEEVIKRLVGRQLSRH